MNLPPSVCLDTNSTARSAGEVNVGEGVKVHAGISTAQLTTLPAHGTTPACVYAQSSKALLLRPSASKQASGDSNTDVIFFKECTLGQQDRGDLWLQQDSVDI